LAQPSPSRSLPETRLDSSHGSWGCTDTPGGSVDERGFALTLVRDESFQYVVLFDDPGLDPIRLDEPPPLGDGQGPNAVRLLGAAIGNCLAASLQFCLQRARVNVLAMSARVEGRLVRNRDGRFRVGDVHVVLNPTLGEGSAASFDRCVELFEEYCIVTESVRRGIDVLVEVRPHYEDSTGDPARAPKAVKASAPEPIPAEVG
jgi:organic hydroperoxide reductase OsmC/OhrA